VNISPILFIFIIGILSTFLGNYEGTEKSIKSAQFPYIISVGEMSTFWDFVLLIRPVCSLIHPLRIPKKVHIYPILIISYNRDIVDFLGNVHEHEKSIKSTHFPYIIVLRGFVDFLGNACS
jgi:hypothetical protein